MGQKREAGVGAEKVRLMELGGQREREMVMG